MKLVVGLGNPGDKYYQTRHNVGFMVVDVFSEKLQAPRWTKSKKFKAIFTKKDKIFIAKPQAFVNESGESVKKIITQYKIKTPDLWVIHDDLDISLGDYKVQKGKGPKQHKGLLSIYDSIGTKNFWHVRVGVDNRQKTKRVNGERYVLQRFKDNELVIINNTLGKITDRLVELIGK